MKKTLNLFDKTILLRKGYFAVPEYQANPEKDWHVRAAIFEHTLNSLGYTQSEESTLLFQGMSVEDSTKLYSELSMILKHQKGALGNHYILYTDFPNVPSDAEKFIIQIVHYLTGAIPEQPEYVPFDNKVKPVPTSKRTVVKFITIDEANKVLHDYIQNLISSPIVWSTQQKFEVLTYISDANINLDSFDLMMPCKENMVTLLSEKKDLPLEKFIRTTTDLLRYIVAVNKGDITLARPCRLSNHYFNRKFRRSICACLDNFTANSLEDMFKYREQWLRVGEKVHPGEFYKHYPKTAQLFSALRQKADHYSFNSKLDEYMKAKDVVKTVDLLKTRPGEFARKLDWCIRNSGGWGETLGYVEEKFYEVADKVSIPVLLQLISHFEGRTKEETHRTFFLKEGTKVIENNLTAMDEDIVEDVVVMLKRSIKSILSKKEFLDDNAKVYINPEMYDVMLPDSLYMRQASGNAKPLTRGTILNFDPNAQFLRFFTHWRNINISNSENPTAFHGERVDIDVALLCFDKDGKMLQELSWRSQYGSKGYAVFSGDITDAPNGASEFIDLDLTKVPSNFAYGLLTNNSYTGQPFVNVPELYSGVMVRDSLGSKTLFDPATVELKSDLINERCDQVVSFMVDFTTKKLHWLDLSSRGGRVAGANVSIFQEAKTALDKCIVSVGEFFEWLCNSHDIEIVENTEEATFNVGKDVTKYDLEEVMKYM